MTAENWIGLFIVAALVALGWTWLITWAIRTYGNYNEEEE